MFSRSIHFLVLFTTLVFSAPANAWNHHGHMMVAKIAWDGLTPQQRQRCVAVLRSTPKFEETLLKDLPENLSPEQRDQFIFIRAATWPDQIKGDGMVKPEDVHRTWHYVDFPYIFDNLDVKMPELDWQPGDEKSKVENAIEALRYNESVLSATSGRTPADLAVALCWYLHLVGDIHQPLHATEVYSNAFPHGDQGGNLVRVMTPSKAVTPLHSLWDGLLGSNPKPTDAANDAVELENDPAFSLAKIPYPSTDLRYEDWAKESYLAAVKFAYANGAILPQTQQGELMRDKSDDGDKDGKSARVDEVYLKQAGMIARMRCVIAGVRLNAKLRQLLH